MPSPKTPTVKQQPQALISLYLSCYQERYGKVVTVNRYKERWAFQDMIDSIGYDRSVDVVRFYFEIDSPGGHKLTPLFYNFDSLDRALTERDADRAYRAKLREETKRRLEQI